MFVPKKATARSANRRTSNENAAAKALFALDAYLTKRDFVGALTLLRLQRQDQAAAEQQPGNESWCTHTWWLAYCHFQCGDYTAALDYFDQLLQSEEGGSKTDGDIKYHDTWRLNRACCLYYLQQFEAAEQAALGTARHALCHRLLFLLAHRRKHGEQVLLDRYQRLSSSCKEDQLALAFASFQQRNFQECIEIYKRLLQQHHGRDDDFAAVHVYLAMCYFKMDYYDVSLELLAVYLTSHPDSFFATNLKACNQYRLYNGDEAHLVIDEFKKKYPNHVCTQAGKRNSSSGRDVLDATGMRDVAKHNAVVFQEPSGPPENANAASTAAVSILTPLIGHIDEAHANLVLFYLHNRQCQKAFELVEDKEPRTPTEYIIKGILHGIIGEETHSKEHVFLAEKYFHTVGVSPEDADTIPGRQSMASYFMLRKEYEDANVYLSSIAQYLTSNDSFNWNYGISLAAAGKYADAEGVLLRVRSEGLKSQLTFCSWLARCYIYNNKSPDHAWELYLKMESTSDAYKLLKLIANDCYKVKNYYYAVKAFDVLERLDPDPEYWEAKRGACVGFFQQMAMGEGGILHVQRSDEVLQLLSVSKNALEASKVATLLKKWMIVLFAQPQHKVRTQKYNELPK
uniref:Intraflagellar transport protein 56 n=1 Tax=Globisporangium ultimum (strain ATCC 200006 / CBS 805.95 / DAOM BR144) TaxID=431595 RepID=K3WMS7_GLOUD